MAQTEWDCVGAAADPPRRSAVGNGTKAKKKRGGKLRHRNNTRQSENTSLEDGQPGQNAGARPAEDRGFPASWLTQL